MEKIDVNKYGLSFGDSYCDEFPSHLFDFNNCTNLSGILSHTDIKKIDIEARNCTSLYHAFEDNFELKEIYLHLPMAITLMENAFYACENIEYLPFYINTKGCENFTNAFGYMHKLKYLGFQPDTSSATTVEKMFNECHSLSELPWLDLSNVEDMSHFCSACYNVKEIPFYNTSKCKYFWGTFGQTSIKHIPLLDLSSAINISFMFSYSDVIDLPKFNTSNVKEAYGFLYGAFYIEKIPQLDFRKVTNLESCFEKCRSLTELPEFETPELVKVEDIFTGSGLIRINGFDFTKAFDPHIVDAIYESAGPMLPTPIQYMLLKNICTNPNVKTMTFTGAPEWGDDTPNPKHPDVKVDDARQSLIDTLLTFSCDRSALGYETVDILLCKKTADRLTEEEKEAITNKGYTLVFE